MELLDQKSLRRLGAGESIDAICRIAGITRDEFVTRWTNAAANRVPSAKGTIRTGVRRVVEIDRDEQDIPHIYAQNDPDLFFGFGYAIAQDRLFQLDWLRRKGAGRLSEIVGREGLESDLTARIVGLNRIAAAELDRLPEETRNVLDWFAAGVNALMEQSQDRLPIEFDLLDYEPQPWSALDCLLIENEFRWYLTGRFPVIAIPELAKRTLGEGSLYRALLTAEADDESILQPGDYAAGLRRDERVGAAAGDPDSSIGSNNWVIGGTRSKSGKPMVASDPHIAFEAVSCWYEVHLQGGSFDVAGCAYVGMPAVLIGRNRRMAWGITNNICSLRDLYQERTSPQHPGCFLYGDQWKPARERNEVIAVCGSEPVTKRIQVSHNGPIVDEILPAPANETGPVSLKWLGGEHGGWLTALLGMNRASDHHAFREAMRPWHVPTFSVVYADVEGNIGYQATGRIPIRKTVERGYRAGWKPEDQWEGLIPFEAMPHVVNPSRQYIATANNRVAGKDFPYPLSGTWSSGQRAQRIREWIESQTTLDRDRYRDLQQDALSLRAVKCVPPLCATLQTSPNPRVREVATILRAWNGACLPKLAAPTVFNVFFTDWCKRVAVERFPADAVPFVAGGIEGLAAALLCGDDSNWFSASTRETAIEETFRETLNRLADRLGGDPAQWTWSRLHRLDLKHVLAARGALGELLNHGGAGVRGDATTVCNTGRGPNWEAATGAGYRMICDLGTSPAGLWAVDCQSQSGHPGSPHYDDQFEDWIAGRYHFLGLDRAACRTQTLRFEPESLNSPQAEAQPPQR
jgi:penicillin amidase